MTIHPDHALSPKESRGTSISLSWGLVQIPVRLSLISDEGSSVPSRSKFTDDGHAIGNRNYDKTTGENYEGKATMKVEVGAEWIELTDDEIAAHSTLTKGIAEIEAFIPLDTIGSLYHVERVQSWTPDRMKVGKTSVVNPAAAKASALLRAAMANADVAALVMVPSKSGGKYHALMPDGRAFTLSFADQVRAMSDPCADIEVSDTEMGMATQLIDGIGVSMPVLADVAGDLLRTYLAGKATGKVEAPVVAAPVVPEVDLMAALAASLAATPAKKAPAKKAAAKKKVA